LTAFNNVGSYTLEARYTGGKYFYLGNTTSAGMIFAASSAAASSIIRIEDSLFDGGGNVYLNFTWPHTGQDAYFLNNTIQNFPGRLTGGSGANLFGCGVCTLNANMVSGILDIEGNHFINVYNPIYPNPGGSIAGPAYFRATGNTMRASAAMGAAVYFNATTTVGLVQDNFADSNYTLPYNGRPYGVFNTNGVIGAQAFGGPVACTESAHAASCPNPGFILTTSSLTTAAAGTYLITVTDSLVASTSIVGVSLQGGSNTTTGVWLSYTVSAGSLAITIHNGNASAALNGTLVLAISIQQQ
jgi:hypothetical protein